MTETTYDVAIVGGGHAGLALALALSQSMAGLRIAILDRRDFAVPRDNRAFAIAAGVRRVFETIGVWDRMSETAEPIRRMKITDSGEGDISRPLFLSFDGEVAPGEPFAHMVPNAALSAALFDALAGKVEFLAPVYAGAFGPSWPPE